MKKKILTLAAVVTLIGVGFGQDQTVNGNLIVNNTGQNHTNIRLGHEMNDRIIVDNSSDRIYGGGYFFRVHDDTVGYEYRDIMTLTERGNVGIGITSPVEILQIANAFAFHDGGNKVIGFGYVPRTGADLNSNGYASEIRLDPVNGRFRFGVSSSQSGNPNSFSVMTLTKEQRVGIGTQSPDELLTVKGKIHAEEVRVDLSVPADYVFEKYYTGESKLKADYTMPTLEEVEAFTKANNHLPDVPSAKQIQEEGLHLKEMTNLLLQKVEELTLYTIEQEKRIKKQEEKIEQLEGIIQNQK